MKLIDTDTNEVIADIMANRSMSIDEALEIMNYAVDDNGQIIDIDNDNSKLNAWYDNLDMIY